MSIRIGDRIISGSGGAADGESLINQNTSSSIEKVYNWVGTITEYEEQDVANIHPDWVCYIIDDETGDDEEYEVYEISGRNVGDIFFTSRKDLNLSGAVECDGGVYNLSDYTGVESIEELLKSNKLPYVSISEYNTLLETNGSVGVFGWDGNSASTFRVPTLNEVFIESGKVSTLGDFIKPGLPNITGKFGTEQEHNAETSGAFSKDGTLEGRNGNDWYAMQVSFDASRSSDIYGSSDTVQPQSVCYRPMIQLATGIKEESIYNIENHALFDNRITNCVTYIPQDIKLEINSTKSVTIKAGTKVYIPNRFESDGTTRHFDTYTYTEDYICEIPTSAGDFFLLPVLNGTIPERHSSISHTYSGDTTPTVTSQYAIWYDTANNIIKLTNDTGATWYDDKQVALPIAIEHCITANTESSISQIFNGFGYIGNITFILPGVTAAFADGFNENGTYKNFIVKNQKVNIKDLSLESSHYAALYVRDNNNLILGGWGETNYYEGDEYPSSMMIQGHQEWWYNTLQNKVYRTTVTTPDVWEQGYVINVGTLTKLGANENITEFKVNKTLKILDYNNTEYMAHQAMPSDKYIDLTLGASGTSYIAPADGWFYLGKFCIASSSSAGNHCMIMRVFDKDNNVVYIYQDWCNATATTQVMDMNTPVKKGAKVRVEYSLTGATNSFRFIYAEGSK